MMLSRSGIKFSEAEQEVIKALDEGGNKLAAQDMILDRVRSKVGGLAKEMVDPVKQMSNSWGEVKESVGGFFEKLLNVSGILKTVKKTFDELSYIISGKEVPALKEGGEASKKKATAVVDANAKEKKSNKDKYTEFISGEDKWKKAQEAALNSALKTVATKVGAAPAAKAIASVPAERYGPMVNIKGLPSGQALPPSTSDATGPLVGPWGTVGPWSYANFNGGLAGSISGGEMPDFTRMTPKAITGTVSKYFADRTGDTTTPSKLQTDRNKPLPAGSMAGANTKLYGGEDVSHLFTVPVVTAVKQLTDVVKKKESGVFGI
jgi:hypothetical protein